MGRRLILEGKFTPNTHPLTGQMVPHKGPDGSAHLLSPSGDLCKSQWMVDWLRAGRWTWPGGASLVTKPNSFTSPGAWATHTLRECSPFYALLLWQFGFPCTKWVVAHRCGPENVKPTQTSTRPTGSPWRDYFPSVERWKSRCEHGTTVCQYDKRNEQTDIVLDTTPGPGCNSGPLPQNPHNERSLLSDWNNPTSFGAISKTQNTSPPHRTRVAKVRDRFSQCKFVDFSNSRTRTWTVMFGFWAENGVELPGKCDGRSVTAGFNWAVRSETTGIGSHSSGCTHKGKVPHRPIQIVNNRNTEKKTVPSCRGMPMRNVFPIFFPVVPNFQTRLIHVGLFFPTLWRSSSSTSRDHGTVGDSKRGVLVIQ